MTDRGRAPALAMIDALRERAETAERETEEYLAAFSAARSTAYAMEQERDEARREHDAVEATLAMTVARLGGMVDGHSTHRVNFLQRIDELRAIEREYSRLYARTLAQT